MQTRKERSDLYLKLISQLFYYSRMDAIRGVTKYESR
jgi:hypothetical protein